MSLNRFFQANWPHFIVNTKEILNSNDFMSICIEIEEFVDFSWIFWENGVGCYGNGFDPHVPPLDVDDRAESIEEIHSFNLIYDTTVALLVNLNSKTRALFCSSRPDYCDCTLSASVWPSLRQTPGPSRPYPSDRTITQIGHWHRLLPNPKAISGWSSGNFQLTERQTQADLDDGKIWQLAVLCAVANYLKFLY